ncbi:hypothetical protein J4217_04510 [Candidatus Pacearchaeota archaeon]|nr:hypothetical protein [Candidatus Pacearchaeota archaeon]
MNRLKFDSQGKLDGFKGAYEEDILGNNENGFEAKELKKSDSLTFLEDKKIENILEKEYWSLFEENKELLPLKFSNGKTQEDIVKEVIDLIKKGEKVIFIHGVCGTGKSAIALNIARVLGKTSIVVPIKGLQRQYEEDYMGKKYLVKHGKKMKIAMITGRDNHDSIIKPGKSCNDPFLPDTIQIVEKNLPLLEEFYENNPLIKNKDLFNIKKMKRIAIAPSNPYWSPIIRADIQIPLEDAKKKKYRGLNGKDFIFYHRKNGCSYYDQYQAYLDSDIIIFNSAKYKIEVDLDRKPETEVEIIDEADEFLDSFSTQQEINLNKTLNALRYMKFDDMETDKIIDSIIEFIKLEEKNKRLLGIDETKIYRLRETKIGDMIRTMIKFPEIRVELELDEANYARNLIELVENFKEFFDETYVSFRKDGEDLIAGLVTTELSKRFEKLKSKTKALVFMSGTLHNESVLKNVFGVKNYKIVEAETLHQGNIEIIRTGEEFDCKYANFQSNKHSREQYLKALLSSLNKAQKPILIHVNAYDDLPTMLERDKFGLIGLMPKETLIEIQQEDKTGRLISTFKSKLSDTLFTTKCSRGVDFPGDVCNSVIFTKYPNPNVRGVFWKILKKTHGYYYWDFYFDKAKREFLQKIYRALRSKDDHVYVLSPDIRVINAVRELQLKRWNGKGD